MEIKRDAYLQQLIERKDNGMIKVITGIRRCGKSYLLFTIFKRYLLEIRKDAHLAEMKYMLRIPLGREECAKRILFYITRKVYVPQLQRLRDQNNLPCYYSIRLLSKSDQR